MKVNGSTFPAVSGTTTAAGITDSSATGRSVLTGTPAQGQTALGVYSEAAVDAAIAAAGGAGARITPTFASGQGWTIVAPTTPGDGVASFEIVSSAPVGRFTLSSAGTMHGLDGPRIERAFPQGVESWKATVRLRTQTPNIFLGLYVRDGSSAAVVFTLGDGSVAGMTPAWNIAGPGSAGEVTFDSTCFLALRGSRSIGHRRGSITGAGVWTPRTTIGYFEPTHIGVIALSDGAWTGVADVDEFSLETFG